VLHSSIWSELTYCKQTKKNDRFSPDPLMRGMLHGHNCDILVQNVEKWASECLKSGEWKHVLSKLSPTLAWQFLMQGLRPCALELFNENLLKKPARVHAINEIRSLLCKNGSLTRLMCHIVAIVYLEWPSLAGALQCDSSATLAPFANSSGRKIWSSNSFVRLSLCMLGKLTRDIAHTWRLGSRLAGTYTGRKAASESPDSVCPLLGLRSWLCAGSEFESNHKLSGGPKP